ncbi:hypothetical protein MXM31_04165 [Klebsiella aerogenes]|uniref:hypothetical protein n=1 Tax=Klebsiella aerogenes TaxID=548 RepID=UPI002DB5F8A3|nr:hypothetical protein [Klebsiella aerogenes]MEB5695382.1 hypothetical protein [Klebsiella aerogenes]
MDKVQAFQFLRLHQPMPADCDITQELIDKYDEVRRFFRTHPDKNAIPLLLQSFGDGDGLGVYQLIEDCFYQYDANDVIACIATILENPHTIESVRYWCTLLTMSFPERRLLVGLDVSVQSSTEDVRDAALSAIKLIEAA